MQTLWAYGKHYEIDDNVNLYNFINEKRRESEENRAFEELRKENERLRRELKEKETQLILKDIHPNISLDIGPETMETIIAEGTDLASQLAIEGLRKAPLQKGFKINWKNR